MAGYSPRSATSYLYIGNLTLAVTEDELRLAFGVFGQVVSVSVMSDAYIGSQQPRAYAYVEMALKSQGEAAVHGLDGKMLGNRSVSVVEALPISHNKDEACHHSKYRRR
ncbi:MAG: RNA-binding protein [Dehalococcoidia bacterium]|nr:MAG: RNA-binding protein [Dehalococcoidia bacterium]